MELNIQELIDRLRKEGRIPGVTREFCGPYKMEVALQVVTALGRARNPRFRIDDDNRFVYENLIRWVHGDREMEASSPWDKNETLTGDLKKGIWIAGPTGSGKSWAMEIMSLYSTIDKPLWKSGQKIVPLTWECVRTSEICQEYARTGEMGRFKDRPVLCCQDLGSEPSETLYMGNRLGVMQSILEGRGDDQSKLTLITTNLPLRHRDAPSVESIYGQRVVSRLQEMCNFFYLTGNDRRSSF